MKKLLALILSLALSMSLVSCGAKEEKPTPDAGGDAAAETIVIGNLQDISGGSAPSGVAMKRGIEVAVEEINAAGGIDGKLIECIFYDTKGKPEESLNAYNRLVEQDKAVVVIGPPISNIGLALIDAASSKKVPIILPAIDKRVTQKEDGTPQDYMFLNQPTNEAAGAIQASYLLHEVGAKKVALFYDQSNAFGVSQVESFRAYVESHGGEVVSEQIFKSGDKDFKTQLTKIKESGAEGIFAPNYPQDNTLYVNQLKQLGMEDITTMGGLEFAPPYLTTLPDPTIVDNVYFAINIAFDDPGVADLNKTVIEKYDDVKTVADISVKTYLGYDAVYILKAALETIEADVTGEAIKNALETVGPIDVKTGTYHYTTESHQPIGLAMVVYKIENGENIKIGPYATKE